MTVIAEYSLPAEDFFLGRAAVPEIALELERLFGADPGAISYFWAQGDCCDEFERSLSRLDDLVEFRAIDGLGDRQFYRGCYDDDGASLVSGLVEYDGSILSAEGDADRWNLRVAFLTSDALSEFQTYCMNRANVGLELESLYNPVESPSQRGADLTPRQRDTLLTAFEEGYFDIPRKVTLVELAKRLDVSDQAVSERLRRGESKLIQTHLLDD